MSSSWILSSFLDSANTGAKALSPSMARAKELLDLIKSPTAVATGVLLAFTRGQLTRNAQGVNPSMTRWALAAAVGAVGIAAIVVAVMSPLAYQMTFVNDGPVETELLVYGLTYLVAIGTMAYAGFVVTRCWQDLPAPPAVPQV